jgi:hypothetical protein
VGDDGLLRGRRRTGGLEGDGVGGWAAAAVCGAGARTILLCQVWAPGCARLLDRAPNLRRLKLGRTIVD